MLDYMAAANEFKPLVLIMLVFEGGGGGLSRPPPPNSNGSKVGPGCSQDPPQKTCVFGAFFGEHFAPKMEPKCYILVTFRGAGFEHRFWSLFVDLFYPKVELWGTSDPQK